MKNLARHLIVPVLLVAALIAPSSAAALDDPWNDNPPGWSMNLSHEYGGTMDMYTTNADKNAGNLGHGNMNPWGWDMFYTWTAPIAGKVRIDLCQTNPGTGGEWYLTTSNYEDFWSPLQGFDIATSTGCSNAAMPQGDFTAVPGKKYWIVIGGRYTQAVLSMLRISYLPQVATATTIAGSPAYGQTLRATPPTFTTPADKHSLSWPVFQRCAADGTACTPISNKGDAAYVVQAADAGSRIRVDYTASNAAGDVVSSSALTGVVTAKPVDADGDGIPDDLTTALKLPAGAAGFDALCTTYTLCKNDGRQSAIFQNFNSLSIIDGALLDLLLGTLSNDLLVAKQDADPNAKVAQPCDGSGGNDVCVGSPAPDRCIAYIGDDFCLGNKGNDTCLSKAGNDVCYGGEGIDTCLAQPAVVPGIKFPPVPSAACFGGSGNDACLVNVPAPLNVAIPWLPRVSCAGGTANDTCKALAAKLASFAKVKAAGAMRMSCVGDAGNDACSAGAAPSKYSSLMKAACSGGTGKDLCVATGAADWTDGKFAAFNSTMTCTGGPGNDTLWTLNGKTRDRINGGGQAGDVCFADAGDIVTGCGHTLIWKVSPADLKLIDGTPAQRAQFVRSSVATLDGERLDIEAKQKAAADLIKLTADLTKSIESSQESIRKTMQSLQALS